MFKVYFNYNLRLIYCLLFIFFSISCNETPVEPINRVIVSTNSNSYSGISGVTFTIINGSERTIYLPECNYHIGVYIQIKLNNFWNDNRDIGITCKEGLPYSIHELKSKEIIQDTILFSNQSGVYRLKYIYSFLNTLNIIDSVFSNEFNYFNPR